MWPRVTRISDDRRTASEKSWVIEVSAARNRLPKLWPSRPEPFAKRWRKSWESRASSSLRATIQLRMSPGGSMLSSLRRLAQGDDTVADVARRKHVEFLAQASAGATVIADRDHGTEVANDR